MSRTLIPMSFLLIFGASHVTPAFADPPVISTPASEHFNGISYSPDGQFGIAVGNAGAIVHFDAAHPNGQLAAFSTAADLYDVYVVDQDFAVASGFDVGSDLGVLLFWNGSQWAMYPSTWNYPILPIWAAPEKDVVMFDFYSAGGPFDFRSKFDPIAGEFAPGGYAGSLDLTFCGKSNDIKSANERGDMEVLGNDLSPIYLDGNAVRFDNPSPLSLSAAWITPASCQLGPLVPANAFAINSFNDIWHFDGGGWVRQQDVPADQTLSWISGTGGDHVLAVGYKASVDSPGSNQGVIWQCDDSTCSDVTTTLFPGGEIPGLTDLTMHYSHQSCVHVGGFEDDDSAEANDCVQPSEACAVPGFPGDCMTVRLAAEDGAVVALDNAVVPPARVDVRVSVGRFTETVGSDPPYHVAQIHIQNIGPDTAQSVGVRAYVESTGEPITVTCPGTLNQLDVPPGIVLFHGVLPSLSAGAQLVCDLHSSAPVALSLSAVAEAPTEISPANNRTYCPASKSSCSED